VVAKEGATRVSERKRGLIGLVAILKREARPSALGSVLYGYTF
jgi:hypothetical protein